MVNAFARDAMVAGKDGKIFPLAEARKMAIEKNRTGVLSEQQFMSQPWLATKVLMPSRSYIFHERKPQVDHIFPFKLTCMDDTYRKAVDVVWNFQPIPAEVNRYKSDRHPKEFFNSEDGGKYWDSYDFIPKPDSPIWDNHVEFVSYRRSEMHQALQNLYGLNLASEEA